MTRLEKIHRVGQKVHKWKWKRIWMLIINVKRVVMQVQEKRQCVSQRKVTLFLLSNQEISHLETTIHLVLFLSTQINRYALRSKQNIQKNSHRHLHIQRTIFQLHSEQSQIVMCLLLPSKGFQRITFSHQLIKFTERQEPIETRDAPRSKESGTIIILPQTNLPPTENLISLLLQTQQQWLTRWVCLMNGPLTSRSMTLVRRIFDR